MTKTRRPCRDEDTLAAAMHYMAVGNYRTIPILNSRPPAGFVSVRASCAISTITRQ